MGFFDSLLGNSSADASNAAAADTYAKQQAAIKGLTSYGDTLPGQFSQLSQAYAPYSAAGGNSLSMLMNGLGLGNDPQSFVNAYRAQPGYQAALDRGLTGVAAKENAGGVMQSGAGMKALQRFGQDYEDQSSGNYMQRLMGMAGMGQQATGAQVGTQAQGLQDQLATRQGAFQGDMQSAPVVGQGMVAGAQAQQSALQNLMGMGAYLGGSALGGGFGTSLGKMMFS